MATSKPDLSRGKISIITPVLNGGEFIADAVESVLAQDRADFEHIVVDGGSTDATLAILSGYRHLKVVPQAGNGLYEAINLGLSLAKGEIIGHLNSDDLYLPGALALAAGAFRADPGAEIVSGGAEFCQPGPGGSWQVVERRVPLPDGSLPLRQVTMGSPAINARFFRRSLYDRVGSYDIRYKVAGDREFLLRALRAGVRGRAVEQMVYRYRMHGQSLTLNRRHGTRQPWRREQLEICRDHLDHGGLPPQARREYLSWHAWEMVMATWRDLGDRRPGEAWRRLGEGARWDRLWPVRGAWLAARRLARGRRAN